MCFLTLMTQRMGEHVSSAVAQLCNESAKVQNSVVWGAPGCG